MTSITPGVLNVALCLIATPWVCLLAGCRTQGALDGPGLNKSKTPPGIEQIAFTALTSPRIEVTRGHPHSPSGITGRNLYNYDGWLSVEGRKVRLVNEYHPFAMYRIDGGVYLLSYYWFQPSLFEWQVLQDDEFVPLSRSLRPSSTNQITFIDHKVRRYYWLWCLSEEREGRGRRADMDLLALYVNKDARFGYEASWRQEGDRLLTEFLDSCLKDRAIDVAVAPLTAMLKAANADDDPQDVAFVCLALVHQGKEGEAAVRQFVADVSAQNPGDARLSDITWRLEAMGLLPSPQGQE